MIFPKICSRCGLYDKWNPSKKPSVENYHVEGEEMVINVRYPYCGHSATFKRPYRGVNTIDGYVMVSTPGGYMLEHRFVWEQAHGKLEKGIVVHHINGVKQDNRLENLIALYRRDHNHAMARYEPIKVTCPCCQKGLKLIRQRKNEYICCEDA